MMLGSGNDTIGGMAADVRTDVGEDNAHWMTGEGWRQARTVLLYPQVRINANNGSGVTCQVESIIARRGPAKHQSSREGEHWRLQSRFAGARCELDNYLDVFWENRTDPKIGGVYESYRLPF